MANPLSSSLGNYLPQSFEIPEDIEEMKVFLKTQFENFSALINRKDTGSYDLTEIQSNQQFFSASARQKRFAFRQVYNFGAIAPGVTLNIPHGITNLSECTRIYGTCIDGLTIYRPIPYVNATNVTFQIEMNVDPVNVNIYNGPGAPAIVSGIAVIEYLKQ